MWQGFKMLLLFYISITLEDHTTATSRCSGLALPLQMAFPGRLSVVHAHAVIPRDWLAAPGEPEKLCCPGQKLSVESAVGLLICRWLSGVWKAWQ